MGGAEGHRRKCDSCKPSSHMKGYNIQLTPIYSYDRISVASDRTGGSYDMDYI